MKSTPILMSGPLVRAVLSGLKTQTRRPLKVQPETIIDSPVLTRMQSGYPDGTRPIWETYGEPNVASSRAAFGSVGDRLWVRETWKVGSWKPDGRMALDYRAGPIGKTPWIRPPVEAFQKLVGESFDDCEKGHERDPERVRDEGSEWKWDAGESPCRWRPSILMPRWACRLELEITGIRVQRVQDIDEDDARAEGCEPEDVMEPESCRSTFEKLWGDIYGPESWASNPWVWAVSFKRVQQ